MVDSWQSLTAFVGAPCFLFALRGNAGRPEPALGRDVRLEGAIDETPSVSLPGGVLAKDTRSPDAADTGELPYARVLRDQLGSVMHSRSDDQPVGGVAVKARPVYPPSSHGDIGRQLE